MLDSIPKQMFSVNEKYAKQGYKNQIQTLTALGFKYQDCVHALEMCDNQLDDAAIWLTQNAKTVTDNGEKSPLNIQAIEVSSAWIVLNIETGIVVEITLFACEIPG